MSSTPPYPPPPAYPPPPDEPPEGYPPQPAASELASPAPPPAVYPAPAAFSAPEYGSPAYTPAPPPVPYRVSRNTRVVIAAVIVGVLLLIGVIGYAFVGYIDASNRVSLAAGAISKANGDRSQALTTFDLIDQQVSSVVAAADSKTGKATSDQLVTESQGVISSAGADDPALVAARSQLNEGQWLTALSSGRLSAEAGKIDHARKAMAIAKAAAGEYLLLAKFFQAESQSLVDWDTMAAAAGKNDFVATASADSTFQADAATAVAASNAPGLTSQFHDFVALLEAYAVDVGQEFSAKDKASFDAANKKVTADRAALNVFDFTGAAAKVTAYYQHYRTDINAEMDKALS